MSWRLSRIPLLALSLTFALAGAPAPLLAASDLPDETYVGSISWSPDGKKLVVGYRKHQAAVIEAGTGDIDLELHPGSREAVDKRFTVKADTNMASDNWCPVAWSPDGRYIAVCHYLNVYIFDASTGKLVMSRTSRRGKDFDPERVWDPLLPRKEDPKTNDGWREVLSYVTGLQWSSHGHKLAISDANGVHIIDMASGKELYTYKPMQHKTYCVSWSKDGSKLAACSFNYAVDFKSLHVWNARTGRTIRELEGIKHLTWSPDNRYLAYDKFQGIVIYDPVKDKVRNSIKVNDDFPEFYWSPDGKYLAVSDIDEVVVVVDALTGKKVASYRDSMGKSYKEVFPSVFAWAPDGKTIAVGLEDYNVGFWHPGL